MIVSVRKEYSFERKKEFEILKTNEKIPSVGILYIYYIISRSWMISLIMAKF